MNSNGEIKTIEQIDNIPLNYLNRLNKNNFFLDYCSGDLYEYRKVTDHLTRLLMIGTQ
jgi:hypothetical protein